MLPFHTPTIVKVLKVVGLSFFPTLVPTTNVKSLTPLYRGERILGKIGIGAEREQMLPFHTPTVVNLLRIVGLSLFPLLCLQKMRNH